jgi:hypothetical protein
MPPKPTKKAQKKAEPIKMPENFESIIRDFTADLSTTFPEYTYLWDYRIIGIEGVFDHCLKHYPERFFDILYQNDDIFLPTSDTNTVFLPNVEFKMLYSLPGVSDNTKQSIWKYLQLILMTIMKCVQNKSTFGESMNLFDGIDEADLQTKLEDTMKELETFFQNAEKQGAFGEEGAQEGAFPTAEGGTQDGTSEGMPNAEDLHSHLKGLFDGKIGRLAKELVEELSGELAEGFSADGTPQSTQDILKKLFRNPKKLMDLLKKVGAKLQEKMKRGDISHDDLMREASEMMNKMKGAGGESMQQMMKQFAKGMGGNVNMAGLNKMMGQTQQKDRMRAKLEERRQMAEFEKSEIEKSELEKSQNLEKVDEKHFVFKGDEVQEKSVRPPQAVDDWLEPLAVPSANQKSLKPKSKKGKK